MYNHFTVTFYAYTNISEVKLLLTIANTESILKVFRTIHSKNERASAQAKNKCQAI